MHTELIVVHCTVALARGECNLACIMNSLEVDDGPGQTNPRKRKHFRRRVPTPDHTLAQNFKNEFIKKKAKVARVSLKKTLMHSLMFPSCLPRLS